jgi:hypothetical protein
MHAHCVCDIDARGGQRRHVHWTRVRAHPARDQPHVESAELLLHLVQQRVSHPGLR